MLQVLEIEADTFALKEDDLWWPGRFDSVGTARSAAIMGEGVLARLQAHKNAEARRGCGVITVEDLKAVSSEPTGCSTRGC